jgi:branched-chain amino acid transport system permease protein
MGSMLGNILNGLIFGSVLFLISSGLTLSMGLMGYFNLSHGAMFAFSGAAGATVFQWTHLFPVAVLTSMVVAGLIGVVLERGFLHKLSKNFVAQILVTIGFIYILENLYIWIWSGKYFAPMTVPGLGGTVSLPGVGMRFPIYRLVMLGIVLILGVGFYFFNRTKVGALIRAGMDDSKMVEGMGVNISKLHVAVFAVASIAAGLAAGLSLPIWGNSYQAGMDVLLMALIITVVGGMGSVVGAFVFAVVAGIVTSVTKVVLPEAAMFIMYGFMVVVLAIRPRGLFQR